MVSSMIYTFVYTNIIYFIIIWIISLSIINSLLLTVRVLHFLLLLDSGLDHSKIMIIKQILIKKYNYRCISIN